LENNSSVKYLEWFYLFIFILIIVIIILLLFRSIRKRSGQNLREYLSGADAPQFFPPKENGRRQKENS